MAGTPLEVTTLGSSPAVEIIYLLSLKSWIKNQNKWEWWQKARQPRQPWASPNRRRRKRWRRRLVNLKA